MDTSCYYVWKQEKLIKTPKKGFDLVSGAQGTQNLNEIPNIWGLRTIRAVWTVLDFSPGQVLQNELIVGTLLEKIKIAWSKMGSFFKLRQKGFKIVGYYTRDHSKVIITKNRTGHFDWPWFVTKAQPINFLLTY